MRILTQSASASHSQFSAQFSAAPMLLLPAPRIAGLLPARVPSSEPPAPLTPPITVIPPRRESLLDKQRAIWAAQDAELEAFLEGSRQRLAALVAEIVRDHPWYQIAPCFLELLP